MVLDKISIQNDVWNEFCSRPDVKNVSFYEIYNKFNANVSFRSISCIQFQTFDKEIIWGDAIA